MIAFDKNHIPMVTVIIDPTGEHPVILTAGNDWRENGEYIISVTPLQALRLANEAMQFAANSMADELWAKITESQRMEVKQTGEEV